MPSHITLGASQYNAELSKEVRGHSFRSTAPSEREHSADETAHTPEQDFRDAFRRQLSESDHAPQRAKPVIDSNVPGAHLKELPSSKLNGATPMNSGQQPAPSKVTPQIVKQAPTGSPSTTHLTGNGVKQQPPADAVQQRKTRNAEQTEPGDEQVTTSSLPTGQQPVLSTNRNSDDQTVTPDEYIPTNSSGDSVLEAAPATNATTVVTGGLAIAMRIDSPHSATAEAPKTTNGMPVPGLLNTPASLLRASVGTASSETEQRHGDSVSAITGAAAVTEGSTSSQPEKAGRSAASEGTSASDFEAEFAKFRSEPVRGAHVQIDGANNERVDIRLLEHGGALSVSVRSGDAALARALQEHSPELNARLTTEHFRTEIWTPDSGKQASGRTFDDGRGQSQGGFSGEGAPDRRQHGKQENEPAWIEDFENHPIAFQKRIEYKWHQ